MPKRRKSQMVDLARHLGAVRNGHPDWYALAEKLAAELYVMDEPEQKAGQPTLRELRLYQDVKTVQLVKGCSILKACNVLVKKRRENLGKWRTADGTRVVIPPVSNLWKSKNPESLKTRFFECKRKLQK